MRVGEGASALSTCSFMVFSSHCLTSPCSCPGHSGSSAGASCPPAITPPWSSSVSSRLHGGASHGGASLRMLVTNHWSLVNRSGKKAGACAGREGGRVGLLVALESARAHACAPGWF